MIIYLPFLYPLPDCHLGKHLLLPKFSILYIYSFDHVTINNSHIKYIDRSWMIMVDPWARNIRNVVVVRHVPHTFPQPKCTSSGVHKCKCESTRLFLAVARAMLPRPATWCSAARCLVWLVVPDFQPPWNIQNSPFLKLRANATENRPKPKKERLVFQPVILVSGRVGENGKVSPYALCKLWRNK